jgi:RES domain-containing protein
LTCVIWRIAVEAPAYAANDLSGAGAKLTGGLWNSIGTPMVYCSANIALAALETLSFIRTGSLPFNRYLIRIEVPDDIWEMREAPNPLPANWDAVPSGLTSRMAGDDWIASGRTPLLEVPSVIIPDECNILINPLHPAVARITATTVRRWAHDPRFF